MTFEIVSLFVSMLLLVALIVVNVFLGLAGSWVAFAFVTLCIVILLAIYVFSIRSLIKNL